MHSVLQSPDPSKYYITETLSKISGFALDTNAMETEQDIIFIIKICYAICKTVYTHMHILTRTFQSTVFPKTFPQNLFLHYPASSTTKSLNTGQLNSIFEKKKTKISIYDMVIVLYFFPTSWQVLSALLFSILVNMLRAHRQVHKLHETTPVLWGMGCLSVVLLYTKDSEPPG